ncbi:MAG: hypothetical protein JST90_08810 [Bacteroidetes bacterium]|nr:hypothetical protein [Bacteroidota bacterium]
MKARLVFCFMMTLFCAKAFSQEEKRDMIIFVGQKIEITPIAGKGITTRFDTIVNGADTTYKLNYFSYDFYQKYYARYKVLQIVQGSLKSDTINFIVLNHIGSPSFSPYETVLLFVYEKNDTLYHELYQYFDVYKTSNNRWAGSYSSRDYQGKYDSITVKPERISFQDEVSFKVKSNDPKWIRYVYPKPYYKIKDGRAIAVYGNYVEQLAILRQETVIRERRKPLD